MSGIDALELLTRLLFLCAYTLGAAALILPFVLRRGSKSRSVKTSGRFLQLLAFTGIIPSLQVILDAFGVIDNLPKPWQPILTLVFNLIIISALCVLVFSWDSLVSSFSTAGIPADRLQKPMKIIALAVLAMNMALQTGALFSRIPRVLIAAQYGLIVFFTVLAVIASLSATRILRRNKRTVKIPGLIQILAIPGVFLLFTIIYSVSPGSWRRALPPVALIALITLSLRIFLRNSSEDSAPNTIRDTLFNESGLTPREREIARMLADGLSYKEISGRLFISLSTTQTHVSRIYGKLGVNSKTELSLKLGGRNENGRLPRTRPDSERQVAPIKNPAD